MPVSIVVGGQYGSEGKGKVAHFFAKKYHAAVVVRIGGPNSGHTVIDENGAALVFKHLPTACILKDVKAVLTAGNYLNLEILNQEIELSGISKENLLIDPFAVILTPDDIRTENIGNLLKTIGSTGSGLGSAVINRISRNKDLLFAKDIPSLAPYIADTNLYLTETLQRNERIIIEGTQGFGLSLLHSQVYPFTTSRDTTAAAFLSEAGLSPMDVDEIILVIRAFPIRVAGNSGPLKYETTWEAISQGAGSSEVFREYTSVTKKLRRVAAFDPEIVKRAISYNQPTKVVLNHVDYLEHILSTEFLSEKAFDFIKAIENKIGRKIDYLGIDRMGLIINKFSELGVKK